MSGDWADELGEGWVTIAPGIYMRKEDVPVEAPKLRIAESEPMTKKSK